MQDDTYIRSKLSPILGPPCRMVSMCTTEIPVVVALTSAVNGEAESAGYRDASTDPSRTTKSALPAAVCQVRLRALGSKATDPSFTGRSREQPRRRSQHLIPRYRRIAGPFNPPRIKGMGKNPLPTRNPMDRAFAAHVWHTFPNLAHDLLLFAI